MERTVTVTASARVTAVPDVARVSAGIATEAETAKAALDRNSDAMAKLVAGIRALGIDPKDIATSALQVEPRYTNPRDGQTPRINGYRAINVVTIVQRNLANLGEMLDRLVTLGANQMGGLSFEVSKADTLKDEARKEAIANALRRARLYAAAAGAEVGQVAAIAEDTATATPYPRTMAASRARLDAAVPVEPGSQELEASVTVTWALK